MIHKAVLASMIVFLALIAFSAVPVCVAATINVPVDYGSIQAAINAASPGDTVQVASGTYNENVNVNKAVTLIGLDTGAWLPIIDSSGNTLSAPGAKIQGFWITGATDSGDVGIYVAASDTMITGCNASRQ
jgi:nitrous oxidase accessory protein NosD